MVFLTETSIGKISKEGIEKIRKLLKETKHLFSDDPFEESEWMVSDGFQNEYVFRYKGKTVLLEGDNFKAQYSGFPADSTAGEILNLIKAIYEVLRESGICINNPDEEDLFQQDN